MWRDSSLAGGVGNWSWWSWIQVLVWVKSSESSEIGKTGDHELVGLRLVEGVVTIALVVVVTILIVVVVVLLLVVVVLIIISWRLDWESDTFRQVWKWVDQLSLLFWLMVERAAITELAFTMLLEVLAWLGLVVRVNGTKSSLSEVLWERLYKNNVGSE